LSNEKFQGKEKIAFQIFNKRDRPQEKEERNNGKIDHKDTSRQEKKITHSRCCPG